MRFLPSSSIHFCTCLHNCFYFTFLIFLLTLNNNMNGFSIKPFLLRMISVCHHNTQSVCGLHIEPQFMKKEKQPIFKKGIKKYLLDHFAYNLCILLQLSWCLWYTVLWRVHVLIFIDIPQEYVLALYVSLSCTTHIQMTRIYGNPHFYFHPVPFSPSFPICLPLLLFYTLSIFPPCFFVCYHWREREHVLRSIECQMLTD